MSCFSESFDEYLISRIQDVVERHDGSSPTYHRMKEKYNNYYELAEEIVEHLSHDDRETMMALFDIDFFIQAEKEMIIYQQGLKDGIRILKHLEVL